MAQSELTGLFRAIGRGEDGAKDQLIALLYDDLHQLAHARISRSGPMTLLDTTALVHESYLRLIHSGRLEISDRGHFLAYAARVMRSIIVDFIRQRQAERRGGAAVHVTLDTAIAASAHAGEDEVIRVNDALDELGAVDANLVRVVEMRYFAGMTEAEIAEALGVTERTVRRIWTKARLLLLAALK